MSFLWPCLKLGLYLFVFFISQASPKHFDFTYTIKKKTGDLELVCQASEVYPEPIIMILQSQQMTSSAHKDLVQDTPQRLTTSLQLNKSIEIVGNSKLFNVTVKHIISDSELWKAASTRNGSMFECRLQIPNTNYVKRKRISLYPSESIQY